MGEAGPEAIMPLRRLSNGDLGVAAEGAGGGGGFTYVDQRAFDMKGASVEAVQRLEKALAEDRATFKLRAIEAINSGVMERKVKR